MFRKLAVAVVAVVIVAVAACTDRPLPDATEKPQSPLSPSFIMNVEAPMQKSSICAAYEGELAAAQNRAAENAELDLAGEIEALGDIVEDVCG